MPVRSYSQAGGDKKTSHQNEAPPESTTEKKTKSASTDDKDGFKSDSREGEEKWKESEEFEEEEF